MDQLGCLGKTFDRWKEYRHGRRKNTLLCTAAQRLVYKKQEYILLYLIENTQHIDFRFKAGLKSHTEPGRFTM